METEPSDDGAARSPLLSRKVRRLKRAVDVSVCVAGGCLLLPVMLAVAALVKLSSPGSIFYAQERIGLGGVPFRMWKFRTMRPDAEEILDQCLEQDPELKRQWEQTGKLDGDPRVIPWVGHFLRRSSLDELPQLWNVFKGEMSIVGPRPLPQYHLDQFDRPFLRRREQVTPGMTGLWQVSGRSEGHPELYVKWDSHYIENWSPWLELAVLLRTCRAVISGEGAS
jgi:lipopolysaccharide/colanic/teichoic acid biosynthesis glycosyltransferase